MAGSELFRGEHENASTWPVVFKRVNPVVVRLARRLAAAGYPVFSQHVSAACGDEFVAAGGGLFAAVADKTNPTWVVDCRERAGLAPEALSRMTSSLAVGRPRVEWMGAVRELDVRPDRAVATLTVAVSSAPENVLNVDLHVNQRGPWLLVHGARARFEAALPMLTVLADRVLYAGPAHESESAGAAARERSGEQTT